MKNQKTPILHYGIAHLALNSLLKIIKSRTGLTYLLERKGVNGRWLIVGQAYDLRFSMLVKISLVAASSFRNRADFMAVWNNIGNELYSVSEKWNKKH